MKLKPVPATALAGAVTRKCVAALPFTFTVTLALPVMLPAMVSVAVTDWLPVLCRVTPKVPLPLVSVEFAGNVATPSELVKCTEPA